MATRRRYAPPPAPGRPRSLLSVLTWGYGIAEVLEQGARRWRERLLGAEKQHEAAGKAHAGSPAGLEALTVPLDREAREQHRRALRQRSRLRRTRRAHLRERRRELEPARGELALHHPAGVRARVAHDHRLHDE